MRKRVALALGAGLTLLAIGGWSLAAPIGFEASEGYVTGTVAGQPGGSPVWSVDTAGQAQTMFANVADGVGYNGTRGLSCGGGTSTGDYYTLHTGMPNSGIVHYEWKYHYSVDPNTDGRMDFFTSFPRNVNSPFRGRMENLRRNLFFLLGPVGPNGSDHEFNGNTADGWHTASLDIDYDQAKYFILIDGATTEPLGRPFYETATAATTGDLVLNSQFSSAALNENGILDDIAFNVVPEPTLLGLLGLSGLLCWRDRRRASDA